ncbi:MAG: 3-phosphoglycerate dehydrogenase [Fibromonadaceae bacterium]|jgi:D-3-phosphoglycerate dehydrogenase|nr:3-phosphoglycerate dehydrogenase [Fibromonadaceae bacterium]
MYSVKTLNKISAKGTGLFSKNYSVGDSENNPQAILVRSAQVDTDSFSGDLLAVARAGAGVNNITIDKASAKGICVFNTPGANANAVAELVFTTLGIALRNIHKSIAWIGSLKDKEDKDISEAVEKNKAAFVGTELAGKTIGVVGLGKIGVLVANGAIGRGMKVIAYEPYPSIANMLMLNNTVKVVSTIDEVVAAADVITVHVPFMPATKGLLNETNLANFNGSYLLNFARNGIVSDAGINAFLAKNKNNAYITDFPSKADLANEQVISFPHLGASTEEAEENCATMAVEQLKDYLEFGIVRNSVNFPASGSTPSASVKHRIVVINNDVPNMIALISKVFGDAGLNIQSFKNESNGKIGYNLIDLEAKVPQGLIDSLKKIEQVIRVRVIEL